MTELPDEPERDYENLVILHPPMVFDMVADAGWIDCTLRYDPARPPQDPGQDVADVVRALGQYDQSLGGCGLCVDRARSTAAKDHLALVLWPIRATGAAQRFRTMAEALGCPLENGPLQLPPTSTNGRLPEATARLIEDAAGSPPSLDTLRQQVHRPRIEVRFRSAVA